MSDFKSDTLGGVLRFEVSDLKSDTKTAYRKGSVSDLKSDTFSRGWLGL